MDGRSWISAIIAAGLLALAAQAQAADHPGKAVYDAHCTAWAPTPSARRSPPGS
jgi:hypothetical protein